MSPGVGCDSTAQGNKVIYLGNTLVMSNIACMSVARRVLIMFEQSLLFMDSSTNKYIDSLPDYILLYISG